MSRKVSKSCYTLWNQCSLCEVTNSSRKWDSAPVRLRLSWLKYSQSFSTQLPFIHDLATVFGSDAIPSHFIHKSSRRKQVTIHWPPVPAEPQEKAWMIWGHNELQMLLGTLMSRESYAQWPCITLWKSPNSSHM